MLKSIMIAGAASAALLTSACAGYGPGYGYAGVGVASYDGYYDDGYGPFYDGYWGRDNAYYYRDAPGHPFQRDTGNHFRRDAAAGFHPVHGGVSMHGGAHGGDTHHG
jgi:hypothetical protein